MKKDAFAELNAYLYELTRPRWSKRRRAMWCVDFAQHQKYEIPYMNSHEWFNFDARCGEDGTFAVAIDYWEDMETYIDLNAMEYLDILHHWFWYWKEQDKKN